MRKPNGKAVFVRTRGQNRDRERRYQQLPKWRSRTPGRCALQGGKVLLLPRCRRGGRIVRGQPVARTPKGWAHAQCLDALN